MRLVSAVAAQARANGATPAFDAVSLESLHGPGPSEPPGEAYWQTLGTNALLVGRPQGAHRPKRALFSRREPWAYPLANPDPTLADEALRSQSLAPLARAAGLLPLAEVSRRHRLKSPADGGPLPRPFVAEDDRLAPLVTAER